MEDLILDLMSITVLLLVIIGSYFAIFSWEMGSDFVIHGNKGRRLNAIEKWFNGFNRLLKM